LSPVSSSPTLPDLATPDRAVGTEREVTFGYQPALDGIRALAVLAVISYHDAYVWAKGGFLGVDAFFVLSGFLITSLLVLEWRRAQSIALVAFWGRRIRRLLPALLLVIVFVAIYAAIAMPTYELNRLRGDGLAGLFYVANWRFIASGQSYFDLVSGVSPFRHLWSLAIEEQFYLVWPLVVLGCLRLARGRLRVLVGVCVVGTLASVYLMDALYETHDPSRAYFGTDARAHTLLIGCLLALLLLSWRPTSRQAKVAIQVLGIAGAIGVLWAWHEVGDVSRGYYGLGSLAYAVAVAAVIAAAVQPGVGVIRSPLSLSPLRWVGTISYGLYLWHWPIDIWLVHWRVGFGGSALNALRLVVTFAFATASYYLVERPIRHGRFLGLKKPQLRWVAPAGIVLVALTLLISTAGATKTPTYLTTGLNPLPCQAPSRDELQSAKDAVAASRPKPSVDPSVAGRRVLLVGDSIACSLQPGLLAVGRAAGFPVSTAAVIGCGIASGVVDSNEVQVPTGTTACPDLTHATLRAALKRHRPAVVLWLSTWERVDLVEGNRT
jgi:peptidoglycan/LPS O-acetylase OafA/YrhL